jgi:hypothetical protein
MRQHPAFTDAKPGSRMTFTTGQGTWAGTVTFINLDHEREVHSLELRGGFTHRGGSEANAKAGLVKGDPDPVLVLRGGDKANETVGQLDTTKLPVGCTTCAA